MNKFMITAIKTCPQCEGKGEVQHHLWKNYWEENGADSDFNRYDMDNIHRWFLVNHDMDPPDEMIPCHECSGTGENRTETTLREALTEIELTAAIIAAENRKAVLAKG
jgi:RecJ-like exonuclease